ncbi:MAG: response regulator [Longimicrobiales bacterium]|nr:response regulator [Longimicrobiales bacterium]
MTRILVADDDGAVRTALERGLASKGFHVTAVANGAQALDALSGGAFDLVVTDINMPTMDGIELLLRLVEEGDGVKVIAISGGGLFPKEELLTDARLLGAVDVLEKPFDLSTIVERVERALSDR